MPDISKIEGNDDEIKERFAVALKFGTAGLRGVLGAGTNRMNIYVVPDNYPAELTSLNTGSREYRNGTDTSSGFGGLYGAKARVFRLFSRKGRPI